ncbi:Hypothetical protein Minf_2011 [Methylacidiphilum infernorum V4]|uniref:Uncharacterized protein n=1 Tax=Methylacidiphilum infernorum (isolate V4) TaxID=481448 RepID=B3DYL7_METI4|nr:Hypothetical protein Minf_2011 [Methylacidiphilum infernorum V4]
MLPVGKKGKIGLKKKGPMNPGRLTQRAPVVD